ncbi:Eukaryotic DNA topoisomerase I, catalytic core [Aquimixticola soesokkakensis]|uniref:DNA topoisomerase n=1 Tax=Aquimixticola soesokkakensis TaxID=1519096 RepID=A0A1Y5SBD7_9RHOB|nr:DNA topoisomerase IB [Aquimixticola soesokkakensis]SLN35285.1 Eukaryotic DNA topoisomerase I, catalytic core [Aquimixticola soesokkakensis]
MSSCDALPEGLTYYPDSEPGITRARHGRGFTFRAPDGTTLARGPVRARCLALAVPPAYENVWISPKENGHLQATGLDARARKQYRYHAAWSQARAAEKFDRLAEFARALPRIRARVRRDLHEDVGEEAFALAAAVLMIDRLAIRVGNDTYARDNGSYGITTLQRRHLRLDDGGLTLAFTAKGGKKVRRRLSDKKVLKTLDKIRDLDGAQLLTWIDAQEQPRSLTSHALNAYLGDAGSGEFTAKTFRTWAGTLAAFEAVENGATTIKALAGAASARLANTPTVARNSYIHPRVISLVEEAHVPAVTPARLSGLRVAENRLLGFLES